MEQDKHLKKIWKIHRSSETERIRSNTLPGLMPSDEQSSNYNINKNLCTLSRPYSCELYGSNEELSTRFQDTWKVNNDRVNNRWVFPRYNRSCSELLNWSMQCNKGSFIKINAPTKDQLEHMEVEEESTNQSIGESSNQSEESAAVKSVVFSKKTSLRPKMKIKSEISVKQKCEKRHSSEDVNEDKITPTKKLKNYEYVLDKLLPFALSNLSATSAADGRNKCEDLQAKHLLKAKKNFFSERFILLLLFSTILVTFISVFLYENQETRKHSSDFANAVIELKERIHGHENVMELCEYLQNDVPSFKVIVLFGDTGVGKSYTIDIIRKNFPRKYAIRQYFPPLENVKDINVPLLYPNLIILENLKERDLTDVVNFLKARQNTYKDHFVTVLAIFNFEVIIDNVMRTRNRFHDASVIENAFLNQDIEVEIFFYEPLSEYTLERCIVDAIKESKLTLNEKQFDLVKNNLLINGAGCKGAYRHVQVIGRQHDLL